MLKSKSRLRSPDVSRVMKSGFSLGGGLLRARATVRGERASHSRFAVVVSKKVAGNAVNRNRLRRQVFQALRHLPAFSVPHDIVLMVNGSFVGSGALAEALRTTFSRLV